MKSKVSFFRCEICGNIVELIKNGGGELVCCGQPMVKLEANTTEAAYEKHIPVVTKKDNQIHVDVSSVPHPMTEAHFIEWVVVVTDDTVERIALSPNDEPKIVTCDKDDVEVYAYCNLHGLWKADI
ncbi:superoxide reductase [Desulfonispora thiosulfatigenes DSM 11270]|uniref:Desulfoferrodoxin n=1 Tax=Desulfonispora thiosulfatigenes DSM 11270 TaxID=656914 RepID=A0A1W1UDD5_DESTI|nr:desulfoferrodoxin [Desulfonispora thiosulfatigenes]SMB78794.1 superoxide reductase [Desulfonispora thiosulfatigenes DSM 11270]